MKRFFQSLAIVVLLAFAQIGFSQASAGAPAGSTALCKDGTYFSGATKSGACSGHKGVKQWWGGAAKSGKAVAAAAAKSTPAPSSKSAGAAASRSTPVQSTPASTSKTSAMAQAPGGGADKVWLNTSTNVYHCSGTQYYGKTKAGAYVTEAEAKAKGAHPDHGKPCGR